MADVQEVAQRRPKVTACLLTYNHAGVVGDAVQSILSQQFDDFELIVSDDCSTDETLPRVMSVARDDPRVRVVSTPHNLGMAGNANFSATLARGDYIALLHHDDIYAPDLLRSWSEVLNKYPSVGFVSNAYRNHHDGAIDDHPFAEFNRGTTVLEKFMLPRWGCPIRGTAMIRKRSWIEVGGMREQFGLLADVDLWMRLAAKFDVGYVNRPLITVRHDRPEDYPDAYVNWSWDRLRIGHEIYGTNYRDYYGTGSVLGRVAQVGYRSRVNLDIAKWLAYAVLKRRPDMLRTSSAVASTYEYAITRWARRALVRTAAKRTP